MKYTLEELLKYSEENKLVKPLYHASMENDFGYMHMPAEGMFHRNPHHI